MKYNATIKTEIDMLELIYNMTEKERKMFLADVIVSNGYMQDEEFLNLLNDEI